MGYRNYLYVVDKKQLNKIRKMTKAELWAFSEEKPFDDEEYPYMGDVCDKMGAEEAIELGKYIDYTTRLKKFFKPIFKDKDINKHYNYETEFLIAKPEILQEIATIFKEKIKANYQDLLREKSEQEYETRSQFERLKAEAESHLTWCQYLDRLSKQKYELCGSWLYEHEVFNILYLMKVFKPKKQALLWLGH